LTTVSRVWKHVVDGENAAREKMRSPSAIVSQRGIQTVSTVDENHAKPALPIGPDNFATGNNWNDSVIETSRRNIATKLPKAVELACRID
jgi:hypothetical protein